MQDNALEKICFCFQRCCLCRISDSIRKVFGKWLLIPALSTGDGELCGEGNLGWRVGRKGGLEWKRQQVARLSMETHSSPRPSTLCCLQNILFRQAWRRPSWARYPLCHSAHTARVGSLPRGTHENKQLWEKESKCQVLERFEERDFSRMISFAFLKKSFLISSFLHCPPSFPFKSRLTPMIRRALSTKHFSRPRKLCLTFCCQEPLLIWKHAAARKNPTVNKVCAWGEIGLPSPQRDGNGVKKGERKTGAKWGVWIFLTSHLPPPDSSVFLKN